MGVNKTISLDERTAMIADRIPNFSHFVRQKLIEHARDSTIPANYKHIQPESGRVWGENKDLCNPKHYKGKCKACWGVI